MFQLYAISYQPYTKYARLASEIFFEQPVKAVFQQ
jgi:hypothetical protein